MLHFNMITKNLIFSSAAACSAFHFVFIMMSEYHISSVVSALLFIVNVVTKVASWNYIASSENGPSKWGGNHPSCGGNRQSPLDIKADYLKFSTRMLAFELPGYETIPRGAHWELHNTGHLLQIRLNGEYKMQEGGLPGHYKAMQMDFHWCSDEKNGSEHMLNGTRYPMELQIIHYNLKYGSFDEALLHEDGLAGFAFLFKIKENDNPIFAQIIKNLPNVRYKGQFVTLRPVPLLSMLPINLNDYYRYEGSLTQPPCNEIVTWTVFTEFIEISYNQLASFQRSIMRNPPGKDEADEAMKENSRPVQRVHDRIIYSSLIRDATLWTAPLSPISITLAVFFGFVLLFLILGRQQKLEMEMEQSIESISQQLNHHLD